MKTFSLLLSVFLIPNLAVAETIGPWDLDHLFRTPDYRWDDQSKPVHSLLYQGEPVQGAATEVFAFYASPSTLDPNAKGPFPGVVLIHGGGGTAFAEWAHLWAKRGYAAIAMDLSGHRPPEPKYDATGKPGVTRGQRDQPRTRLENGGLDQGHGEKFDSIHTDDTSDDWPYHAAASVIKAHSLLRSFDEVDADRTAVTGISWGGYTTCLVASLDSRFKAAVPVYGCGFLHEGESLQKPSIDKLGDDRAKWVAAYDVSSRLPNCKVPMLFVNGTNDVHYVLDSYQKTFEVVPSDKQMRIQVRMPHGHQPGWAPQEIGLFIDSKCRGGVPLPKVTSVEASSKGTSAEIVSSTPIMKAALHYTTDEGRRSDRNWQSLDAKVDGNTIVAPAVPADANTWFLSVTDDRGAMVTSDVHFAEAAKTGE